MYPDTDMHTGIYTCVHTYIYIRIVRYTCTTCTQASGHMHMHIHTTDVHTSRKTHNTCFTVYALMVKILHVYVSVHPLHRYSYIHVCVHTYIHVCTEIHIIYIHTQTHARAQKRVLHTWRHKYSMHRGTHTYIHIHTCAHTYMQASVRDILRIKPELT